MNSQNQLKEEPVEEYHAKKRNLTPTKRDFSFITIIFFIVLLILTLIKGNVNPYLWLSAFFFLLFCYILVVFLSLLPKKTIITFIGCTMFSFCFAAPFWFLSYKNYNFGYNEAKIKYECELLNLTKNILSSNLSSDQQQEYLKMLFSQHNAKIRIYSKEKKELKEKNMIYQQDFQIKKGVINYELDTDFMMTIPLNDDSKKYILAYTSYKEKEKINPFLAAITFNVLFTNWQMPETNLLFWSKKNNMNSLCFFIPFIVLWLFSLIVLNVKGKENLQRE